MLQDGYYDPARGSDGTFCDAGFAKGLSSAAWSWAESHIIAPLNQVLGQKAQAFGWNAIGDFNAPPYPNSFLQHGYCATQGGKSPQSGTWIRQYYNDQNNVGDAYQGTFSIQGDHNGFMHPNYWGHQRYANSYVKALTAVLPFTQTSTSVVHTASLTTVDQANSAYVVSLTFSSPSLDRARRKNEDYG